MATEFGQIIGPLAQSFFGEPNRVYSSETELRYGARGSLSVDLKKGTWYDHESEEGGGVLDLVARETHLTGEERVDWLKRHGYQLDPAFANGAHQQRPTIVATYDYTDEAGELIYQVCRFEPKDFRQRRKPRPDDPPDRVKGGWVWSVKGLKAVPYRLPEVLDNDDRVICIVEGEKDCDRLWKLGVPATTNAGGAGKWHEDLIPYFRATRRPRSRCFIPMARRSCRDRTTRAGSRQRCRAPPAAFACWSCGDTGKRCRGRAMSPTGSTTAAPPNSSMR
jgi:hypothetical protein